MLMMLFVTNYNNVRVKIFLLHFALQAGITKMKSTSTLFLSVSLCREN